MEEVKRDHRLIPPFRHSDIPSLRFQLSALRFPHPIRILTPRPAGATINAAEFAVP